MAVLKKRALAEYTQIVQEDPDLNSSVYISKKPRTEAKNTEEEAFIKVLEKLKDNEEELIRQLKRWKTNPESLIYDTSVLGRFLCDLLTLPKQTQIYIHSLELIKGLAKTSKLDIQHAINELLRVFPHESSPKIKALFVSALSYLSKQLPSLEHALLMQLINITKKCLMSSSNQVLKCQCLKLIGEILSDQQTNMNEELSFIHTFTKSQDPRVRNAAYRALLDLHSRDMKLGLKFYQDLCDGLQDDYESVRQSSLKMIFLLSESHSDSLVSITGSQEKVRLVDDAFGKICQSIGDLSVSVRVSAAQLLGRMKDVSPYFLEQTLDKKLMSDMRRKRSAHERHWDTVISGEWADGVRWADDKPRESLDVDSISLIHSGACGAFVHGLEDEFMEVRSASLDSLCQLALDNPKFARLSLDFLVDMYNDEIEEVRLKAIDCMTKISHLITLREDQLEIVLSVLEDSNSEIREALHRMLGACQFSTGHCIKMCVSILLDNLKRYPQDKRSIWRCIQMQGSRHSHLIPSLVPELISIHPCFDMPEADIEDPAYVSVLLLIFNAAKTCPSIMSLLEEHTIRHYRYLRDTIPNLLPNLPLGNTVDDVAGTATKKNTQLLLENVMSRLYQKVDPSIQVKIWETALADLQRLAKIDDTLEHSVDLLIVQLRCHLLIAKIMSHSLWDDASGCNTTTQEGGIMKNLVDQLQRLSLRLQYMFSNLSAKEKALIQTTRLQAMAVQLVYIVRASNTSALALSDHFVSRVKSFERENTNETPSFASSVIGFLRKLDDAKPGVISRILLPVLQSHIYQAPFCLPSKASKLSADILEPTGESDNPQRFLAGFVLGINLDAEIQGLTHPEHLRIRIKYPDQHVQLSLPPRSHLKRVQQEENSTYPTSLGDLQEYHRLRTSALVSHQLWSESSYVEIDLVLDVTDPEVPCALKRWKGFSDDSFVIHICQPVRVLISPKPVKRGV